MKLIESKEIWRKIDGFEKLYSVSNYGRVKSHGRIDCLGRNWKEKLFILCQDDHGYIRICLHKDGKAYNVRVHRLVAKAFLPNLSNCSDVNHIDGNKKNNHVSNLEWITKSGNVQDAWEKGLIGKLSTRFENHYNAKLKWIQVNKIRELHQTGKYSQRHLASMFDIKSHRTINNIINNRTWNLNNVNS